MRLEWKAPVLKVDLSLKVADLGPFLCTTYNKACWNTIRRETYEGRHWYHGIMLCRVNRQFHVQHQARYTHGTIGATLTTKTMASSSLCILTGAGWRHGHRDHAQQRPRLFITYFRGEHDLRLWARYCAKCDSRHVVGCSRRCAETDV